jgi:photosystem II stability/assembly factor-like uncharacterized protein
MKKNILLALFSILTFLCYAQWHKTEAPGSGEVTIITAYGNEVFMGTKGGGVFYSNNNGSSWSDLSKGFPESDVYAIVKAGGRIIVGTQSKGIYVSSDKGKSWTESDGFPSTNIFCMTVLEDTVFVGTGDQGIFKSLDYGESWIPANSGLDGDRIYSLTVKGSILFSSCLDREYNSIGGLYYSKDKGRNWVKASKDLPVYIRAVTVKGDTIYAASSQEIYYSANEGKDWKMAGKSLGWYINALASNSDYVYAATTDGGVYRFRKNSDGWENVSEGLGSLSISAIDVSNNNILAGLIYGGGIFVSEDNGDNWTSSCNGLKDTEFTKIVSDNSFMVAVPENKNGLYISNDTGNTWQELKGELSASSLGGGIAINDNKVYAGAKGGIFISDDKSKSWKFYKVEKSSPKFQAFAFNQNRIIAGTVWNGIYFSDDQGKTWKGRTWKEAINDFDKENVLSLLVKGNKIFAGISATGIFVSQNNGTDWKKIDSLGSHYTQSFAVIGDEIFAVGFNGIWRSSDDGKTWEDMHCCNDVSIFDIVTDGTNLFVAAVDKGIYYSTDKGNTWIKDSSFDIPTSVLCLNINGKYLFAGTNDGIWKCEISDLLK